MLEKSIQKPVAAVIAGAGYGKTQVVYMFLQEYEALTVWQQITMLDNLGARFWDSYVNVLSQSNKKLASKLEMLGFPDSSAKFDLFLSYTLEYMNPNQKYVIVYDDFHLLHEKKILRFIEQFIGAGIPNFSFILISRSEPEINIAGLLAKEMITIITEANLCFSISEMIDYYEMQDIHISPQLISKIYADTDGWIIAIRLIELSLKKGVAHEEYAITAMKLNIHKLMESEIYLNLPNDTQIFLAKLSLFDSLPMELVEVLSSSNKQLILSISQISSFIRFDSFSNIYFIHHLFLEFLRQRQDVLTKSEKVECYQKAADWYASNGYIIDAITYYGMAEDYSGILNIALFWPHASSEEGAVIIDIMSKAPKEVFTRDPMIALLRARALWFVGKPDDSMNEMDEIIKRCEALPQTKENLLTLSELYTSTGLSYYYYTNYSSSSNDFRFMDYIVNAYKCMKDMNFPMKVNYSFQDVGTYVCRINSEKKEDMDAYIEAVKTTAYYAPQMMPGCMCGMDALTQAELFYFKNVQKDAGKFANQALYKAREHHQHAIAMRAIFYLIRIYLVEGNYKKIQGCFNQLDLQLEIGNSPVYKTLYDIVISWYYALIGQKNNVANWIKSDSEHVSLNSVASGTEILAKVKYFLCEKRYNDLLMFLDFQLTENDVKSFLLGKVSVSATRAVCLYRIDQKDEAIVSLQEAYFFAEPNALVMQFVELGNDMVALIKFALKSESCAIPEDWLKNVLRKSSTYAKRLSQVALEYKKSNNLEAKVSLTQKEINLLTDICHGLSRAEIASSYDLSPNYVKNRLQSIYAKLGAENANDAIRIALLKHIIK